MPVNSTSMSLNRRFVVAFLARGHSMRAFPWLGIAMMSCLPGISQTAPETAKIVVVVEDQSGAVVAGARVEIQPLPPNVQADSATDNRGNLSLVVPLGSYDIAVTKPGFAELEKHIEVRDTAPQTPLIQIRVATYDGPAAIGPEELALATESAFANARTASFPKESEYRSPDKRYVIVGVNSDREPHHTVFLRDNVRGSRRKLFTYGRSVALLWNINSTTFAVTDYVGSDSAQVSVYSVDERCAPVQVLDLLLNQVPENARTTLRAELTNHHEYLEASAWLSPTVLSVELSGYGVRNAKGFKRFYEARLPESWASH